ncbi:uncharacterized protein LOC128253425 isoform X1 [Drosophila gunungcola]|uniref:Uncharacterized protein n=1 Tax=Drosophila gunungcola TaxID=103775 RepID=A0A9Q0BNI3_9MUSC|nr:uncharacterized protein LOC128253425 isoform X1 [Drosophila gunungcola]KAI8037969.1 hypothetical protein M5D96_009010 [Drosophila gunungcola]
MALNKIDGATNISKQLNRWRNVVIFLCQQSKNAHVVHRPVALEQVVASEAATKMTDNLIWSKNSPVSQLLETALKPQHNRTLELKKAAAQLSRSNESLKAHYIQKRNDRSAEDLLAKELLTKEPQTVQKLANLMSLNIAMVETKRPQSSSAPIRGMESDHLIGIIDFKPQTNHSARWQYKMPSKEADFKNAKKRQKSALKNAPTLTEQPEIVEHSQQKNSDVKIKQGKPGKIAKTVHKIKKGSCTNIGSEDIQDRQKNQQKPCEILPDPITKNVKYQAKWKLGSRSIPCLDI